MLGRRSIILYGDEEDDIPDLHESDLRDMSLFHKLYVIGKILGAAVPIKFISLNAWWNGR